MQAVPGRSVVISDSALSALCVRSSFAVLLLRSGTHGPFDMMTQCFDCPAGQCDSQRLCRSVSHDSLSWVWNDCRQVPGRDWAHVLPRLRRGCVMRPACCFCGLTARSHRLVVARHLRWGCFWHFQASSSRNRMRPRVATATSTNTCCGCPTSEPLASLFTLFLIRLKCVFPACCSTADGTCELCPREGARCSNGLISSKEVQRSRGRDWP